MSLTKDTRGYIESLAAQINAAYDANIFDGCAVLMRRLLEICLIYAFEHCVAGASIQRADGGYIDLSEIINQAKANSVLSCRKARRVALMNFELWATFRLTKSTITPRGPTSSAWYSNTELQWRSCCTSQGSKNRKGGYGDNEGWH
jgi:hypothetical protein